MSFSEWIIGRTYVKPYNNLCIATARLVHVYSVIFVFRVLLKLCSPWNTKYIKTIYLAASLATCDDFLPADIFQKLFGPRSKCLTPLDILGKNYFKNNQQATKRHSALPSMQKNCTFW